MNLLSDIANAMIPEFIIAILVISSLILTFVLKDRKQNSIFFVAICGLALALFSFVLMPLSVETRAFYESFVSNPFTATFRILVLLGTMFAILLSKRYVCKFGNSIGEFYTLILTATLGGMLLIGANDLIMLFVGIETLSISSFALCGYTKLDKSSNESALKYLIIGAASSAIMLYGFSFLYGITGQTNIFDIVKVLPNYQPSIVLILSFIFILAGFGYKLSAVPFHVWAPDVYQGAPIPVAAYLSVVSKIAAFAALARFMTLVYSEVSIFTVTIALIAVLTMTAGNLMAIGQQNIRRLMAYSSIAQAGYVLLGLAVLSNEGISGMIFYLIAYLFMNFGTWAAIQIFASSNGLDKIQDFNGLANKNKYFSLGLAICLMSLAGLPFTSGFFAKFYLFKAVAFAGLDYIPLLLIALVNTIISLFYYVRIINAMYVKPCAKASACSQSLKISLSLKSVLLLTTLATLLIGFFAGPIINITDKSAKSIVINKKLPVESFSQISTFIR